MFAGSPVTTTRLLSLCSGLPPPPCPGQAADTRVTRVYALLIVRLFAPSVPYQDNGCDCGVFVCRYAFGIYNLLSEVFTRTESENKFKDLITDNDIFDFKMENIAQLRRDILS